MSQRCGCGHGECWACWQDQIEEDYIKTKKRNYCECGLDCCAVCSFYNELDIKYGINTKS